MRPTSDLHVLDSSPLITPNQLKLDLPLTERAAELVRTAREEVREVLSGANGRTLVIVGPCSTHDPAALLDYAGRLLRLRERYKDDLLIVMRVYFEKPRTTVGWKGLINDPHLNGTCDVAAGVREARKVLMDVAELGMPAATEMLDPILPRYLSDLVTWAAIGARTTESQTHREMASGLSMPVGYKNGTDGSLAVAINALVAAAQPHSFLGIDADGRVAIVRTTGNPDGHVVLRGGNGGPNYSKEHVEAAVSALRKARVCSRVLIDCSHDNSGKSHLRQSQVVEEVARQIKSGQSDILGVMIESNIVAGRQTLRPGALRESLVYGQSITDACIDFDTTERVLDVVADAARANRFPDRMAAGDERLGG
jgi:3-deoxy-7-phosphoheptulonate synthase